MVLGALPIVQAPMAGGVSTPALAAAVSEAGGLGFLPAGYKSADALRTDIASVRERTAAPFGVNVFVPGPDNADPDAVAAYRDRLAPEASRYGVPLGEPDADDDDWDAKLSLLHGDPVPVVSFTFGCPPADVIASLRAAGSSVVVTVTTLAEADLAARAGADALCVQGIEAGGHRGSFTDDGHDYELAELLQLVASRVTLPLIAAGGITQPSEVTQALKAGAVAAQCGTAFLRCPEAGTNATHRAALTDPRFTGTAVTRAFTGRRARGLANRFLIAHDAHAPAAYPQLHHMTKGLRRAAAQAGDPEGMSLWAGTGYRNAQDLPAAQLVRHLAATR